MNLIDEWRVCYKYMSVQANAIGTALAVGYTSLYDQLKDNFPPRVMAAVTAAVFILGIIGRVVSQTKPDDEPK